MAAAGAPPIPAAAPSAAAPTTQRRRPFVGVVKRRTAEQPDAGPRASDEAIIAASRAGLANLFAMEEGRRVTVVAREQQERTAALVFHLRAVAVLTSSVLASEDVDRAAVLRWQARDWSMLARQEAVEAVGARKRTVLRLTELLSDLLVESSRRFDELCEEATLDANAMARWHTIYRPFQDPSTLRRHGSPMKRTGSPLKQRPRRPPSVGTPGDVRSWRQAWNDEKTRVAHARQRSNGAEVLSLKEQRCRSEGEADEAAAWIEWQRLFVEELFANRRHQAAREEMENRIRIADKALREAARQRAALKIQCCERQRQGRMATRRQARSIAESLELSKRGEALVTIQACCEAVASQRLCFRLRSGAVVSGMQQHETASAPGSPVVQSSIELLLAADGSPSDFPALRIVLASIAPLPTDADALRCGPDNSQHCFIRFAATLAHEAGGHRTFPFLSALSGRAANESCPEILPSTEPETGQSHAPQKRFIPVLESRFSHLDTLARCHQPPHWRRLGAAMLATFQAAHQTDPRNIPYMERIMHLHHIPYRVPTPPMSEPVLTELPGLMALFHASSDSSGVRAASHRSNALDDLSLHYLRHVAWCAEHGMGQREQPSPVRHVSTQITDVDEEPTTADSSGIEIGSDAPPARWWPYTGLIELFEEERDEVSQREACERFDLSKFEYNTRFDLRSLHELLKPAV